MAAFLLLVLLVGVVSGSYVRYPRNTPGGSAGFGGSSSGSGAGAGASSFSSSFSSSSGTKVAPGPGATGHFNAFSGMSNFGPPAGGDTQSLNRGGAGPPYGNQMSQPYFPGSQGAGGFSSSGTGYSGSGAGYSGSGAGFSGSGTGFPGSGAGFPGFPGYNPYVPQYGQQYPWVPFPNFAAPFDFTSFLNQYFQSLQNFQAQAEAQAQQAAASGHGVYHKYPGGTVWSYSYPRSPFFSWESSGGGPSIDTNEVGGVGGLATATYGPQGGYGNANVFPKPEGGLDSRFGGEEEAPQNSIGGGPVSSVGGSFKPPGGSSFGVFTSSSSGSSDVNGKKTSFKQSSIGVNDNGKVTTYTAHDP